MLHCVTHWPFCPGVFIAILGVVAVILTCRLTPETKTREKVLWIITCFALMFSEIWMMSKDRDAHDASENKARGEEASQSAKLDLLTIQSGQAITAMLDIEREQRAAKGNTALLASLQSKADAARVLADDAAKQFAIAMEPNIAKQIFSITDRYELTMIQFNDSYGNAEGFHDTQRMNGITSARRQETATYQDKIVGLLSTAYPLQQQLLRGLTPNTKDQEMTKMMKNALGRDFSSFRGTWVANYLDELAKRAR
jgi:hypothetical protein